MGAKNLTVKRIQEWLNYHQFRTGVDSDFGPATAECIRDFQAANGVATSGKVTAETWKLLVKPMRDALEVPDIAELSAPEAVLAVAERHITRHPIEIGGPNCGPWVRLYCKGNDGLSWAWCAGFVTLVMQQAYFYRQEKPPIEGSVSCDSLAAQAKRANLFVSRSDLSSGRTDWDALGACCIFLRRRTTTDWTHTGFAMSGHGQGRQIVFSTIEGNTNDEGSREGFEACRRTRSLNSSHYDFIRFQ
ncbi:MAG: peptidoglycan-binding domain-containing protein [Woeseiaceae bacterium]